MDKYEFSEKQKKVLAFPYNKNDSDILIADGAIRSGKTVAESLSFLLWAMGNFSSCNFIIGARSTSVAVRNIIRPYMHIKYLQRNFEMRYNYKDNLFTCKRGEKINFFYVFGGNNEKSQDVVQGLTAAGAYLDEAPLMPKSFFEQCLARCSVEGSLIFINSNPQFPSHWFKKEWIDKAKEKKITYFKFLLDDNPSLSDKVKSKYYNKYSGIFFQRNILGQWVAAEGIIFEKFANNPEKYIIDEIPKDWKLDFIDIGIDFGGTISKTAFVAKGVYNVYRELVFLDSEEIDGDYTLEDLRSRYLAFEKRIHEKYKVIFKCFCDSAEPILIRSLKNCTNYSIIKSATKSSIFGRIKFLNSMFQMKRLHVMRNATHLIKAFQTAVWDPKKPDTRLDNGSVDIDVLDAAEYSCENDIKNFIKVTQQLKIKED